MTATIFARPIKQTVFPSEARASSLATILERGEALLDGETLQCVHVVDGGHVLEGEEHAAFIADDGSIVLAALAEARDYGGDDDEDDDEPDDEEGDSTDDEDDEEDEEPDDDEEDDEEEESVNEMAVPRAGHAAIAAAIAGTGLPRKLKEQAAEALAARFEELPGAFDRARFIRASITTDTGEEVAEGLDEAAMTRKHFAMIAQALAELDFAMNHKRELVGAIASAIAGENERFDRARFIKATGLTPAQVSEPQSTLAASVGMEEQMFITYCEEGVQLVNESDAQVALVRCDTHSAVESARAINAIEEYAASVGYELERADVVMDEDTADENAIIEAEWDAVDDMRASLALAIESFDADEHVRYGPIVRQIDEAINEGDFELAEELAEPLLEYKRMGQAARRARIRSIRTGIPKAVRSGKVNRAEHRRQLLQRRRTYRTSAGMRSKAKRYAKRYGRFRARLRPVGGRANESVREILRPLDDILRDSAEAERRMGIAPGSLTAILTQEHADLTQKINEAAMSARINEAHKRIVNRALAAVPRATRGSGLPEAEVRVRTEGANVVVEHDYGDGHVFSETVPIVDEARQTKEEKQRAAEITATYGRWFDRVPVPILKLPAIKRDIDALLASKADLNVEMPKLVSKYKAESVEEAGDKLGVLAGEVMTYLINRPRATAEDLQRKFRCTSGAAGKIMNVAAQALAQGDAKGTYPGHVKAIGDILAADGAFESEGEQRLPFIREAGGESTFGQLAKGAKFRMPDDVANAVLQKLTPTSYKVLTADDEFARGLTIKSVKASEPVIPIGESTTRSAIERRWGVSIELSETAGTTKRIHVRGFFGDDIPTDKPASQGGAVRAKVGAGEVAKALSRFGTVADASKPSAYDVKHRDNKRGRREWYVTVPVNREDDLRAYADTHNLFIVRESIEQDESTKPKYGAKGFQDHSYECREVYTSFKDCTLPAGHKGPHKTSKSKDETVNERVHCAIVLDEAVQLPTNTTIKIPDVRQENRGLPRDQIPTIDVPAFKLAKATVFMPNEMFGNWNRHEVNDLVMWLGRYAQYESALHVQFRVKRKRNASARVLSYKPRIVVYEGWGIDLEPESMFGEPERDDKLGIEVSKGRRMSFDSGWDDEMQQRVAAYPKKPKLAIFESVAGQRVHEVEDGETMFQRGGEPVSVGDVIRRGDRVTIVTRHGQKQTGTAVMRGPAGWVLNLGGAHGTPGIATDRNVSTIKRGKAVIYTDESSNDPEYDALVEAGFKTSGVFDADAIKDIRAVMPPPGKKSKRYRWASKKTSRTFARGETLTYKGEKWRVYDADADGSDMTLYLVSPDFKRWLRDVPPTLGESIDEAKRTPKPGDRVKVKGGKTGVIVSQRMAPPSYSEPEAFSVKLDDVKRAGYVGSMYSASDVELIDEATKWERGDNGHVPSINKTGVVLEVSGSTVTLQFADGTTKAFPKRKVERIPDEDEFYEGESDDPELRAARAKLDKELGKLGFEIGRKTPDGKGLVGAHYQFAKGPDSIHISKLVGPASPSATSLGRSSYRASANLDRKGGLPVAIARAGRVSFSSAQAFTDERKSPHQVADEIIAWAREQVSKLRGAADEARDPLDDIPAMPNMSKYADLHARTEDALTNAIFNNTALGKLGFDRFYRVAGAMMRAGHAATPKDANFEVELRNLQRAFRNGGELNHVFQGSKADARVIAKAMLEVAWNAAEEGLDEADATKKVYIVHWSDPSNPGGGPAGDGSFINRFKKQADAERFARGRPGPYGSGVATVDADEVPLRLWKRWNSEGLIEGLDEKTIECSYCGKRKPKHSGSDAEPYCYECDKRMEKLRDRQHADAKRSREDESIDEGVELPDGRIFDIKTGRIVESTDEAIRKKLDFRDYEALVRTWHDKQLTGALADIQKTLPVADKLDRDGGGSDDGGYYRDQASVIHKEIDRRRKGGKREGVTDESARPSLGNTVREVLQGWRDATPASGSHQVVGFEVGYGTFQIDDQGKIETVERTRDGTPVTRAATRKQIDDIHDSIAKGHFQIENRPIRSSSSLQRWVLHQATGTPLEGEDADEREYTEEEYDALDEAKRKKLKGYWRTTERGQRIFIEKGRITKGNPHLMRAVGGRR